MLKQLFLIVLFIHIDESSGVFDNVYDTGKEVWKLFWMMDQPKLETPADLERVDELFSGPNREFMNQINLIHEQLLHMENSMNRKELQNLLKLSSSHATLLKLIDEFDIFISSIDEDYKRFAKGINGSMHSSNENLQDFVLRIFQNIEDKIVIIRKVVAGEVDYGLNNNLIFAIANYAVSLREQLCDNPQIISSLLVRVFEVTMIAEMKVQVMLASMSIHRYPLNEQWKSSNLLVRDEFARHFGHYVNLLQSKLALTDTLYLRACDPANGNWQRNESFYEMEEMSQATLFRYHWTQCTGFSCNDILRGKSPQCDVKNYDRRSSCSGTADGCAHLSSIEACVLKRGPHRFQYVNSTVLGSLGRNFECPKDNGYMIKDGKDWYHMFSTCACNCYKNHNKISLAIVESDVKNNKIITGVRFVRKERILYIQPREGTLDANCYIKPNSERWISLPTNISESQIHSIDRENRVFFLDELRLPFGFILTGVKFNKGTRGNVTGFSIEIFGVPFDYKSGELDLDRQFRTSIQASNQILGPSLVFEERSSVHTNAPHIPSSERIRYVRLERSSLRNDFGQSTLPLFDAVSITTHPPTALGGIKLFHKGVPGYAGFISLRVYGITYAEYFNTFKSYYMRDDRVILGYQNSTIIHGSSIK